MLPSKITPVIKDTGNEIKLIFQNTVYVDSACVVIWRLPAKADAVFNGRRNTSYLFKIKPQILLKAEFHKFFLVKLPTSK